ncbi:MAG: hypothetical protein GC136_06105 [Alphaproteobacteria bacterium]|nr:hypothetical protein [Alphaproteobacteria bacterium]
MIWRLFTTYLCLIAIFAASPALANEKGKIPRFASLKSNKVHARAGPGTQYPIKWVYQKKGLPLEIIYEFEGWRRVRDMKGDKAWVHNTLLSGQRTAIIKAEKTTALYKRKDLSLPNNKVIASLAGGLVVRVESCDPKVCEIDAGSAKGYIKKELLWGIYPNEQIK